MFTDVFAVAHIIPSGIGACLGEKTRDAVPATNLMATVCDFVLAHPNVFDGIVPEYVSPNVLCIDGYTLDRFFFREIALRYSGSNRIGVILDSGAKDESIRLALDTLDFMKNVNGVDIVGWAITEKPVGGRSVKDRSGVFKGIIEDPRIFLRPAKKLIKNGADAIAVSTFIDAPKKDLELYFHGKGQNPYTCTEILISHTISGVLGIPCAHSPLISKEEIVKSVSGYEDDKNINLSPVGSIIHGLHNSPLPVPIKKSETGDLVLENLNAVVLPASCMGGIPALAAQKHRIPIIAVDNKTSLDVTPERIGFKNTISVSNYLEAAGVIASMSGGIDHRVIKRRGDE